MKKILLLNLIPNTIGDNILLSPMIKILRKHYPNSTIDLTISKANYDLFKYNPNLNNIYVIPELKEIGSRKKNKLTKIFIYFKLIKRLKNKFKNKYDTCFVLLPNNPLNILIPKLAKIKNIYGYAYKGAIFSFLLTKKTEYKGIYDNKICTKHFMDHYLDLLKLIGIDYSKEDKSCEVFIGKKEHANALRILKEKNLKRKNYICFQAGSKSNGWPIDNFKELAKILTDKGEKIVLMGSPKEKQLNDLIKNNNSNIINLSGISLLETAAILKDAKYSICNDSGLAHLSSAVGTKTIVLFGPHHPNHCIPLGKGKVYPIFKYWDSIPNNIKRGSKEGLKRINNIKVNDVLKFIKVLKNEKIN